MENNLLEEDIKEENAFREFLRFYDGFLSRASANLSLIRINLDKYE
jgi:hypothetical protein